MGGSKGSEDQGAGAAGESQGSRGRDSQGSLGRDPQGSLPRGPLAIAAPTEPGLSSKGTSAPSTASPPSTAFHRRVLEPQAEDAGSKALPEGGAAISASDSKHPNQGGGPGDPGDPHTHPNQGGGVEDPDTQALPLPAVASLDGEARGGSSGSAGGTQEPTLGIPKVGGPPGDPSVSTAGVPGTANPSGDPSGPQSGAQGAAPSRSLSSMLFGSSPLPGGITGLASIPLPSPGLQRVDTGELMGALDWGRADSKELFGAWEGKAQAGEAQEAAGGVPGPHLSNSER